jgi:hypothetical protein
LAAGRAAVHLLQENRKAVMMRVSDAELIQALSSCRSVAVVGAKDKAGSPVDRVGRYLIEAGFQVFPVHPVRTGVWGLTTYKSLLDIPSPVDVVNLFRASEHCLAHAQEVLAMNPLPKIFWMQLGVFNFEARALLAPTPIRVFEDLCLMIEHRRLIKTGS